MRVGSSVRGRVAQCKVDKGTCNYFESDDIR
jgi:hypothetical protein